MRAWFARALLAVAGIAAIAMGVRWIGASPEATTEAKPPDATLYREWTTFTESEGLPSNKAFCVRAIEDEVWVGTDHGVAVFDGEAWQTYTTSDGLCHDAVLSIDFSPVTGDVWLGTMGGANRYSAGRIDQFHQLNSGLANNVVYGVGCHGQEVWFATAAGASRFDTRNGEWHIYSEHNAPMHEIWNYGVATGDPEHVYLAVWGGGVLEFDVETEEWTAHTDPDKEMEIDLFPNDGLVHDITSSVTFDDGVLWAATYFGLSRYDGRHWKTYMDDDSGLVSTFINFVRARGNEVWVGTDRGLSMFDGIRWVTYTSPLDGAYGGIVVTDEAGHELDRQAQPTLAHNFVLGIDFDGDDVWVATSKGLSRGRRG